MLHNNAPTLSDNDTRVLNHMRGGHSITQDYARTEWGLQRLAAHILRIRQNGFIIEKRMIKAADGGQIAEYFRPASQHNGGGDHARGEANEHERC